MAVDPPKKVGKTDLLILFAPVYAFRLASITEDWIKTLHVVKSTPAAIIAVSGGGEISPNTACRIPCKRLLERKGYTVRYENMVVMPSNFASQASLDMNLELLRVLPKKAERMAQDLVSGRRRTVYPHLQDRIFTILGYAEHMGARVFGASVRATHRCNQCGLCVRNCPQKNIRMVHGIPKFGFRCIWCLKCIYGCPRKALVPRIMKSAVLKEGFDMGQMIKESEKEPERKRNTVQKNILWQGVIKYLAQEDGIKR